MVVDRITQRSLLTESPDSEYRLVSTAALACAVCVCVGGGGGGGGITIA